MLIGGMMRIPVSIDDAVSIIEAELSSEDYKFISRMAERDGMCIFHSSIGRELRNEWGFWNASSFARILLDLGFTHPDDMTDFILESVWNSIHSIPNDAEWISSQVAYYKEYWKQADKEYDKFNV